MYVEHYPIESVRFIYELYDVQEYMKQHRCTYDEEQTIIEYAFAATIGYGLPKELDYISMAGRETIPDYFNRDYLEDWKNDIIREIIQRFSFRLQGIIRHLAEYTMHPTEIQAVSFNDGVIYIDCQVNKDPYLTERFQYYGVHPFYNSEQIRRLP